MYLSLIPNLKGDVELYAISKSNLKRLRNTIRSISIINIDDTMMLSNTECSYYVMQEINHTVYGDSVEGLRYTIQKYVNDHGCYENFNNDLLHLHFNMRKQFLSDIDIFNLDSKCKVDP